MANNNSKSAHILAIYGMSIEEKLTALAFQGLANRDGANVLCKTKFWNWPKADEFWTDYFIKRKGFSFEEVGTLPELIKLYPGVVKGLIIWDPRIDQSKWVALILAGLKDCLPVAPECIDRYGKLPIVDDLRGKFNTELEAATYSADNLIDECDKKAAYSIERTWSGATVDSLDYAIQRKMFVYCLNYAGKVEGHGKLIHKVLSDIGPGAAIFGWGEPEDAYCETISFHDNYVMCAEAPNLSFWAHVPCERTDWTQPARKDPSTFNLENKHYITLMTSEGDTPKMAVSVQGGAWLDPKRGEIPVNWGMNPRQLDLFPAILEFYWDSATENDWFTGGAGGAGYTYPNRMPNPEHWMKEVGEYMKRADMQDSDMWMHFSRPVYEKFAELTGIKAFDMPCGPYGTTLLNGGEAVAFFRGNSGLNYFSSSAAPKDLAEHIKNHCGMRNAPTFSVALVVPDDRDNPTAQGGWNPSMFVELRELLGDDFKIVTMQEMTEVAIKALKEGKCPDCASPDYSEWDDIREKK